MMKFPPSRRSATALFKYRFRACLSSIAKDTDGKRLASNTTSVSWKIISVGQMNVRTPTPDACAESARGSVRATGTGNLATLGTLANPGGRSTGHRNGHEGVAERSERSETPIGRPAPATRVSATSVSRRRLGPEMRRHHRRRLVVGPQSLLQEAGQREEAGA